MPKPTPEPDGSNRPGRPLDRSALEGLLIRIEGVIGRDRLGILVESRLRERSLLLDTQLVMEYLLAQLAALHADFEVIGPESLIPPIDRAILGVMLEAESEEVGARLHEDCYSEDHILSMQYMGVESALITRATRRFNSLQDCVRETFFAACLDGKSLESCKAMGLGSTETVGDAIYFAFTALLTTEKLDRVRRKRKPRG